ncbi:MAG: acylphosphatase [Betaproteobacteria bacterium]
MIARRLVIRGRVQGVGYRYAMIAAAEARDVAGWVRNRRDGSVDALVQGAPAAVESIVGWCRRGPADAEVTAVEVVEAAVEPHAVFATRPTA